MKMRGGTEAVFDYVHTVHYCHNVYVGRMSHLYWFYSIVGKYACCLCEALLLQLQACWNISSLLKSTSDFGMEFSLLLPEACVTSATILQLKVCADGILVGLLILYIILGAICSLSMILPRWKPQHCFYKEVQVPFACFRVFLSLCFCNASVLLQ